MNNRIINVTKRQPLTKAIVFGGTEAGVSDIKTLLAPAKVNVSYVGRDEWHPMLNSAEQSGEWYYDPFLVLTPQKGSQVRVEFGDIIVIEDRSYIKRPSGMNQYAFSVYSPSVFGEYYEFIPEVVEETIEEKEEEVADEQHDDPPVEFDNGTIDGVAGDHPEVSG